MLSLKPLNQSSLTNWSDNMSKAKQHAAYLYEHYLQSDKNQGFVDMLYQRIVQQEQLKLWEAKALANEFNKLRKTRETT
jgi:hypothetical protein